MKKGFEKLFFCTVLLLACLLCSSAWAEVSVTFSPEAPRAGDYVDVTVTPGRQGAQGVSYTLLTETDTVCKSDVTNHYTASFRPREETVYTLNVTVVYGKKDEETVSVTIPVSGTAPVQEGADVVYSQKDGWWHSVIYSKKNRESLEKGGCAIFSLSHILQRLGFTGGEILPDTLAAANSRFYIPGRGTDNPGLISKASRDYGFITQDDLVETEREIVTCLRRGDLLTFSIVIGHIAMADGISEDGTLVHVVDSAPGATYERINRFKTKGHIFYREQDGSFTEALSADQLPGIRWFFETGEYGGMAYWMDLPYCAYRGMRIIRQPWLQQQTADGLQAVVPDYSGALVTKVIRNGESYRIPTRELVWTTGGAETPQLAVITRKGGAALVDGAGKALKRYAKKQNPGTILTVLNVDEDLCYVFWKDTFCYIARSDVDLLPVQQSSFATGLVSLNGKTAGKSTVIVRTNPGAKAAKVTEWTIGTPVAVVQTAGEYILAEGKGRRGWIHQKYFTPDAGESTAPADQ